MFAVKHFNAILRSNKKEGSSFVIQQDQLYLILKPESHFI